MPILNITLAHYPQFDRTMSVGWVDKTSVSDGLWACWVYNPIYPLCHFFLHSTILGMACRLVSLIF